MSSLAGAGIAAADANDLCAREPIHIIGEIQSHGLLFALGEPDLLVQHVSRNVETFLNLAPDVLVGASFEAVLGSARFAAFRHQIAHDDLAFARPLRVAIGPHEIEMNCVSHRYDDVLLVELEPVAGMHSLEPVNLASDIGLPLVRMEQASDLFDLSNVATREIRRLTGFDRVMVYRFDTDWNGEVIAETTVPSTESYLGLRFPASDIPAQARRLLLVNPLRAIADVNSIPVPMVPDAGPAAACSLNLTRSFLRSAAAVHLEYLRNMRVAASLTVSIIVGGRLWGMIACHHATPRCVDWSTRAVCELVARILASQIALRTDNAELAARLRSRQMLENYMAGVEASSVLFGAQPFGSSRLLELFDADGLVSRHGVDVFIAGTTISETALLPVIDKMARFASRGIASSNMLSSLDVSAEAYAPLASGALYVGLGAGSADYLLLLRRELVETVMWAGNPDKAVHDDGRLRPRATVSSWQQTVRARARRWTALELENARFLREQLLRRQEGQLPQPRA